MSHEHRSSPSTVPIPGPINELRLSEVTTVGAAAMLQQALAGVELGAFDREALDYIADRDTRVTVAVASLLRRAWAVGVEDGRAEHLDEAATTARAAAAADRYARKYAAIIAGDHGHAQRQLALSVTVESAVALTYTDAELAAAVRAIVAADQAEDAAELAALQAAIGEDAVTGPVLEDPADVVDQDHDTDVDWCRICGERPANGDGVCFVCRVDIAEGRINDADDQGRADDHGDDGGELLDDGDPGDDGHANAGLLLLLVCLTAGVLAWLPVVPGAWQTLIVLVGAVTGLTVLRRVRGVCRACGHRGSWRDPLTLVRRPRVHARHVPAIRASRIASEQAAGAALADRLTGTYRAWVDSRCWLPTPAGCCRCGTGGPYYAGSRKQVTRYVYVGACGEPTGRPDWTSCSRHPIKGVEPLVDYGRDVVVSFAQTEADAAAAWAARTTDGGAS